MWFWIGLALILGWGGWGYWRRRWWLRDIGRSLGEAQVTGTGGRAMHYEPPPRLVVPDRIITAIAGSAVIIGLFLVIGSRWGWFS